MSLLCGFELHRPQYIRRNSLSHPEQFNADHFAFGIEIEDHARLNLLRLHDLRLIETEVYCIILSVDR